MIGQSPAKWFANLSARNKTIILSKLVYEFTLIIRDVAIITPFDDSTIRKLSGIGEMTHRIMPYIIAINLESKERFDDEELVTLLFEMAHSYGLSDAFEEAWRASASMQLTAV